MERKRAEAAPPPADRAGGASALILMLLRKIAGPVTRSKARPKSPLPEPGRRSGEGAASVAPYLDQVRNTRPGPLE